MIDDRLSVLKYSLQDTGWAKSQFTYVGLNSSVTECSIEIILSGMTYYHHCISGFTIGSVRSFLLILNPKVKFKRNQLICLLRFRKFKRNQLICLLRFRKFKINQLICLLRFRK